MRFRRISMNKKKILDVILRPFFSMLNKASRLNCYLAGKIAPIFPINKDNTKYLFYAPNLLTRWRYETLFLKEPETIEWIDSFGKDEVLFDIGANVGIFTIYAAMKGAVVIAFEPESQNYALLNKNIYLNNLSDRVIALNAAFIDKDCVDYLYIKDYEIGTAINSIGESLDWKLDKIRPSFKQGIMSYTLDSFLSKNTVPFPNHIKIDVDGFEYKILKGAQITLKDPRLKSISVELNLALHEHQDSIAVVESFGWRLKQKRHADLYHSEEGKNVYNCLFHRIA
jgi:FkbM family methyltransferase